MKYEDADKIVRKSAIAAASAHLALMVLDASVLASSLPNIYVSDPAANCGARNLAAFAAHYILMSGLLVIAAYLISVIYSGLVFVLGIAGTSMTHLGWGVLFGVVCITGFISLAFFLSAADQLGRLGNLPPLPKDFDKTHACPTLTYLF